MIKDKINKVSFLQLVQIRPDSRLGLFLFLTLTQIHFIILDPELDRFLDQRRKFRFLGSLQDKGRVRC